MQLKESDYDRYDYLIGMDASNIRNIISITGKNSDKIKLLLSYCGRNESISDPWYTGNFTKTYEDIYEGCKAFLEYVIKQG